MPARDAGLLIRLKRDPQAQAALQARPKSAREPRRQCIFDITAEQHAANQADEFGKSVVGL